MPESDSEKHRLGLAQLSWEVGEVKKRLNEGARTFSKLNEQRRAIFRWAVGGSVTAALAVMTAVFNIGIAYSESKQQKNAVVKLEVRVDDIARTLHEQKAELGRQGSEMELLQSAQRASCITANPTAPTRGRRVKRRVEEVE